MFDKVDDVILANGNFENQSMHIKDIYSFPKWCLTGRQNHDLILR